jgi:HlyD family secretion protein
VVIVPHQREGSVQRMNRRHMSAGRLRRIGAAGCGALAVLLVASCTSEEASRPTTATVQRAAVTSGVSGTGSITAASQQNMGFPNGGHLTNVFVKVGDRVEPGQVIATIDDFALRQTLQQQQAQLNSQQAALDRLINSPVADGAKDSLSQAQEILDKTRKSAAESLDAAEQEIDNAERKLDIDKKALETAKDKLEADERACDDDSSSSSSSNVEDTQTETQTQNRNQEQEQDQEQDQDENDADDSTQNSSGTFGIRESGMRQPTSTTQSTACSNIPSDKQAVVSARQTVVVSENAVETAKKSRDSQKASGELSIANAEQSVVSARNTSNSESSDRPFDIEEQRGAVVSQQAAVADAQRDVDDATLRAPAAATVSAINGVVGEYLSATSNGTSALAPGSQAGIPGVDSASAAQAAAGVGANPARPGGTQFLVLDNIDAFQIVVPFNESDAATIQQNQKVNVSVDALPDVTLTGTVLSVAPTGTAISGVVTYYVTMVVEKSDPRIKDGQTVRATVVTEELDNVLTVPSSAVRQENGRATVTVVEADGTQKSVPFEPGKVGADRTQVLSGLREGQQIVLPTPR